MFGPVACVRDDHDPLPAGTGYAMSGPCETDGEQVVATTGGDHGEAWHNPFGPDSPDSSGAGDDGDGLPEWFDAGIPDPIPWPYDYPMPDPQVQPDPTWWEFDPATAFHYRSATTKELAENGWHPSTLLVVPTDAARDALARGARSTVLALPIAEDAVRPQVNLAFVELDLELRASHGPVAFPTLNIDQNGRRTRVVRRPNLHFYVTRELDWNEVDDIAAKAMASSDGATELTGAMGDRVFAFRGPFPIDGSVHRVDIAPPRGSSFWLLHTEFGPPLMTSRARVGVELVRQARGAQGHPANRDAADLDVAVAPETTASALGYQCADGFDNDVDGRADSCDYECVPHPEFGGLEHQHTALSEYSKDIALLGDAVFCAENPSTALTMMATWGMGGAQLLSWIEAPEPYAGDVRTPPFRLAMLGCITLDSLSDARACHSDAAECPDGYPFTGTARNWDAIALAAWDAVETHVTNLDPADVHPVNFAVVVTMEQHTGNLSDGGLGNFPDSEHLGRNGTAVVWSGADDILELERVVAHEIGHTLGLAHDTAAEYGVSGIMNPTHSPWAPVLDWDAPSAYKDTNNPGTFLAQGEVWGRLVGDKWFPRPRGFKLSPCSSDADCEGGFPGLECVDGVGWCK